MSDTCLAGLNEHVIDVSDAVFFWLIEMKAGEWGYSEGKRLLKEGNKIRVGIQESCMHMDNSNRFLGTDGKE